MTDTKYFKKQGYELCDTASPYFDLMVKKFEPNAPTPMFTQAAKHLDVSEKDGIVIYYTDQCPFNAYYIKEMEQVAHRKDILFQSFHINSYQEAQALPSAYGTFNVFFNGQFLTHYIQTEKRFEKMLDAALSQ